MDSIKFPHFNLRKIEKNIYSFESDCPFIILKRRTDNIISAILCAEDILLRNHIILSDGKPLVASCIKDKNDGLFVTVLPMTWSAETLTKFLEKQDIRLSKFDKPEEEDNSAESTEGFDMEYHSDVRPSISNELSFASLLVNINNIELDICLLRASQGTTNAETERNTISAIYSKMVEKESLINHREIGGRHAGAKYIQMLRSVLLHLENVFNGNLVNVLQLGAVSNRITEIRGEISHLTSGSVRNNNLGAIFQEICLAEENIALMRGTDVTSLAETTRVSIAHGIESTARDIETLINSSAIGGTNSSVYFELLRTVERHLETRLQHHRAGTAAFSNHQINFIRERIIQIQGELNRERGNRANDINSMQIPVYGLDTSFNRSVHTWTNNINNVSGGYVVASNPVFSINPSNIQTP